MEGKLITDKVALQTIIGLKFVKKNDIVLIQYNGTKPESKMFWNVILNTAESVRLKQNITAKDILDSLNHTDYVQISQTMIINIHYLSEIELKSRKCILLPPFEKYECVVSRLYLKVIRKQFELQV